MFRRRKKIGGQTWSVVAAALAVWCLTAPAPYALAQDAQVSKAANYDIPPQPLELALQQVADEVGLQLLYSPVDVRGVTTRGLKGRYSAKEAIDRLIEGTGLTASFNGQNAVAIKPKAVEKKAGAPGSASMEAPTIIAQGQNQGAGASEEGARSRRSSTTAEKIERIEVTGSRLTRASGEGAQPIDIYTKERIEASGQRSVSDFLNTIPQASVQSNQTSGVASGGGTTVRLHGLPVGTTLVLINGRRSNSGFFSFIDLNSIPLSAVDRIEVIPVGSSAIYGSDAIAGVVNIILKKSYEGGEAGVRYGGAKGTESTNVTVSFGKDFGRAAFSMLATFENQTELRGNERTLTSLGDLTPLGGRNFNNDICDPGNVYSLTAQNLPGLSSRSAGIPGGISGRPNTSDFQSTAGSINTCSLNLNRSLIPPQDTVGVLGSGHYQFGDALDAFGELLYSRRSGRSFTGGSDLLFAAGATGFSRIPATNAFNPFGIPVGVSYLFPGRLAEVPFTVNAARPVVGLRGDFLRGWYWEATAQYAYEKLRFDTPQANSAAISAALASSDQATALNLFTTGAPGSPGLLDSLSTALPSLRDNRLYTAQAFARGPLLTLPAGSVEAVIGAEYNRYREYDVVNGGTGATLQRTASAAFAEGQIPILSTLQLSLAGRYDRSNDFGGKATGQSGIDWKPIESILVRATYGTAYRAPTLNQISGATTNASANITDPARGNQVYVVPLHSGANPDLHPETGESYTLGGIWSSTTLRGLELGLTNWSIKYQNFISQPSAITVLNFPSAFPASFVVRAPATPQDVQSGFLGAVTDLRTTQVNFGGITVSGFDFDASYKMIAPFGELTPALAVTKTYRYDFQLTPSLPKQTGVSQALTSPGFAPRWKGTASVSWKQGAYSMLADGRYLGHYNDFVTAGLPAHDIGNYWLYDLSLRYQFDKDGLANRGWLRGATVSIGGVNIFNTLPKASYVSNGYDPFEADIRGRFLYIQLSGRF